ncbi:hypothetical protein [uncultured Chryseobacterium sp.]|uniref:hypothetical protein n=1 Tax=uncultured Chryseobacterium sp. TaxID=259322 RepID=UPI002584AC1B|nr:hypothetical protein [uncultured Chryseobacterium sp.]
MNKQLLLECSINIAGQDFGLKIFKDDYFTFELSEYLQDANDADVYRVGSNKDSDLESLLRKLNIFKQRYTNIIRTEINPHY